MSNDLVEQPNYEVEAQDLGAWGDEEISSSDLVVPRLWLMQALSELVAEKEVCSAGEIVDSLTEEVVGGIDNPVGVVPFKVDKLYYIMKDGGDRPELEAIVPWTKANDSLPREFTADGVNYFRQKVYKFYVVREGEVLPFTIIFKSMGLHAGKQLFTEAYIKNKMAGKSPAAFVMNLGCQKQKNDKGVFYSWTISRGEAASAALQGQALQWRKTLETTVTKEHGEEAQAPANNNGEEMY